jgi:phage-related baseplate assembly protein
MAIGIDDLITPMTVAESKAAIYDVLDTLGVPTTGWKTGSVVRTIVALVAVIYAAATQVMVLLARAGFRELATDDWLTLTADQVYGVTRIAATFATGAVTLTNAGGGVYSLDAGELVVSSSVTGTSYVSTAACVVPALGTVTVAIQALEAGSASSVGVGEVDTMVTSLLGVTCANAAPLVGTDEETDAALRSRCDDKLDALSPNGAAGAYSYVATTATRTDGAAIGVNRVSVSDPSSTGAVTVTIADADGAVSAGDVTIVDGLIQSQVVPLGVTVTTQSATASPIAITYELWIYTTAGLSSAEVKSLVSTALTAWMSTQPIGGNVIGSDPGKVFVHAIRSVIMSVSSYIINATVTLPAADVTLTSTQVPTIGAVTGTVNLVTP